MANLKDIRSRIDSTKNTQAITRSMKMVSAAKLRRAQHNIVNVRPYAQTILQVIADVVATQRVVHPLLVEASSATETKADAKKILMIVLTSDRGLCGGFNSNINKFVERYIAENKSQNSGLKSNESRQIDFIFIGKKSAEYFKKRNVAAVDIILNMAKDVGYSMAADIAERAIKAFEAGEYSEVRMVYNEFKSAIAQNVVCERLLPVDMSQAATLTKGTGGFPPDMIFEPKPEHIIDQLVKKHFNVQMYRCMSESVAAEHGARMTAMEAASKNAGEMIRSLTLSYNKIRQEKITTELIEIVSGAEALKG
jgi:F-type H+-transporting ATPase subunit gamma